MESEFSKETDHEETSSEKQMKMEIIKMGLFSFELEEKREQSLITQSGYMLTGFSIISVMLLAAVPILIDYMKVPNKIVFLFIGISLIFLIVSLLFAILTQWRYKYDGLKDIKSIYTLMHSESLETVDDWWLVNLNEIYKSKYKLNERRAIFIKISTGCFGASILTILIYLIIFLHYLISY
ncbi:MAG: hypothetical protein LBE57_00900 [Methanosarcinales archaeon]|jgi:hypothetical protein|nr:hypothetical protein [Methanosarcinales archaeon]